MIAPWICRTCSFRLRSHDVLCAVLSALTAVGPAAPVIAQAPKDAAVGDPLKYIVPGACAVVVARPKQVFASEMARLFPLEVIQAAGIKEMGVDPLEMERLVASVAPPSQGPPAYAIEASFTGAFRFKRGPHSEHTTPSELDGHKYLKSQAPMLPSFFAPDAHSMLLAPEYALPQLVAEAAGQNPLAAQIQAAAAGDDFYARIDLEALRPLIGMALAQVPRDFPAEARPLLEVPALLKSIELTLNVSNSSVSELVVTANSEGDAKEVESVLEDMKGVVLAALAKEMEGDGEAQRLLASEDPVEQAMGRYQVRMQGEMKNWIRQVKLQRDGPQFNLLRYDPGEGGQNPAVTAAVIGVLVALLLPAVQAAREAARRSVAMNHLKQIMLAFHLHADQRQGRFPAYASFGDDGKPLLSWRVHILPYIEQQALYDQFHLDEPWDSDHNRTLIPRMPEIYLDPSSGLAAEAGRTHFLGVKGPDMLFGDADKGRAFAEIRDGTSNTIAVVQANNERATIWTRPDDWEIDKIAPLKGLGGLHPGIFLAGFCDGYVRAITEDVDSKIFQSLLTIAGGEVVDHDGL